MNRFFDNLLEIVIGLLGAVAFSVLLFLLDLFTIKHILAFVIPAFVIITATIFILNRYRKIGMLGWNKHKGGVKQINRLIKSASSCVDILFAQDIYDILSNEKFIDVLYTLSLKNIKIRLLIPKPYSEATQRYAGNHDQLNRQIDKFLRDIIKTKEKLISSACRDNLKLGVYTDPLQYSAIYIDNKRAFVDLCACLSATVHPLIKLKAVKESQTYYDAFFNNYNITWNHSRRVYTVSDINRISYENDKRKNNGVIIAITGPSGAGKTTVTRKLFEETQGQFSRIKTYTTRPPREKSEAQRQYKFVSKEEYGAMQLNHEFVVSAEFCGNMYGITHADVFGIIDSHRDLLLDTIADPSELKNTFGNRILIIYITAKSNAIMAERIRKRGTPEEELKIRLKMGHEQAETAQYCDYIVINEDIDNTLNTVKRIIAESKKEYIEAGDMVAESVIEFTSFEIIGHGLLPTDEVSV